MKLFFTTIYQYLLLIDNTQQSKFRQTTIAFKAIGSTMKSPILKTLGDTIKKPVMNTIGNTIKNSAGILNRKKQTIKNLVFGLKEKQLNLGCKLGIESVNHIGKKSIKEIRYITPQLSRRSNQLIKAQRKQNLQKSTTDQLNGKGLEPMIQRSAEYLRGLQLDSLIDAVSKTKSILPFLFAVGGLERLAQTNLRMYHRPVPGFIVNRNSYFLHKNGTFNFNATMIGNFYINNPIQNSIRNSTIVHAMKGWIKEKTSYVGRTGPLDVPLTPEQIHWKKINAPPFGEDGDIIHEIIPKKNHKRTQIWLQGMGSYTGSGFDNLFADPNATPLEEGTRVRLLYAPPIEVNTFKEPKVMKSWFDFNSFNKKEDIIKIGYYDFKDVKRNIKLINKVIKDEIKLLGGKSENLYLGGFSQGATMAQHIGAGYEKPLGAILGIAGFKFRETKFDESNSKTPVFLAHGKHDRILQMDIAKYSFKNEYNNFFKNKNIKFNEIDNMGHSPGHDVLDRWSDFMKSLPKDEKEMDTEKLASPEIIDKK